MEFSRIGRGRRARARSKSAHADRIRGAAPHQPRLPADQVLRVAADLDGQLTTDPAGSVTVRRTTGSHASGQPTRTAADLADHWLDPATHLEPWSVSHQAGCESIVRTWIRPGLGNVALEDVTDTMLRQFLEDFIGRQLDRIVDSGWFAVVRQRDGQLIEDVVLPPAPWDRDLAEVGWHFARAWQGRGYATEAAAGLLAHAEQHGVEGV